MFFNDTSTWKIKMASKFGMYDRKRAKVGNNNH